MLLTFRVAELTECATRLGLVKSGKKADLQARILAYLGEPLADLSPGLRGPATRPPMQQWRVEAASEWRGVLVAAAPADAAISAGFCAGGAGSRSGSPGRPMAGVAAAWAHAAAANAPPLLL